MNEAQSIRNNFQLIRDELHKISNKTHVIKNDSRLLRNEEQAIRNNSQLIKDKLHELKSEAQSIRNNFQLIRDELHKLSNKAHVIKNNDQTKTKDKDKTTLDKINNKIDIINKIDKILFEVNTILTNKVKSENKMNLFGLSFLLYILKWSAGKGFLYTKQCMNQKVRYMMTHGYD